MQTPCPQRDEADRANSAAKIHDEPHARSATSSVPRHNSGKKRRGRKMERDAERGLDGNGSKHSALPRGRAREAEGSDGGAEDEPDGTEFEGKFEIVIVGVLRS